GKPEEAETNRGSFRLDEDGRAVAQTKTSWISASGLDVHAGSGDLQLSSHADADSEVCLKGAQRPELHASGRNQNKYQTPRTRESATKRAGPCSIEIFQHPARTKGVKSPADEEPGPSRRFHLDGDYRARGSVGNGGGGRASGFPARAVQPA